MGTLAPGEVTALLQAWRRGEQSALNRLVPVLYDGVAPDGTPAPARAAARDQRPDDNAGQRGVSPVGGRFGGILPRPGCTSWPSARN